MPYKKWLKRCKNTASLLTGTYAFETSLNKEVRMEASAGKPQHCGQADICWLVFPNT